MKNLTTFREAGSLIAGLLVGVSIVIPVFAMTIADFGDRQMVWVIVAPIVLASGLILQATVTRLRTDDPRLAVWNLATGRFSGYGTLRLRVLHGELIVVHQDQTTALGRAAETI